MPDLVVKPCSEHVRASGLNAIKAASKKSKSAGQHFYATGMNNVAELAYEFKSGDEKPVVRKTPVKSSFEVIMMRVRSNHYVVIQDKKKEEHGGPNARLGMPHPGVPTGLSGLAESSRAEKALQNDNKYSPEGPHISCQPPGVMDTNQLPALLSMKKRNHQTNQSEVKMCDHKTFVIYWDPEDPGNRNGSFIAMIDQHKDKFDMRQHPCCRRINVEVKEVAMEMATRIIDKFNEDEQLTSRDRQHKGKEPRRPPPHSSVLREVYNMYSQLFRNENDTLIKRKEVLRAKLDAGERRKELAKKTQQEAQRSRQRGGTEKDRKAVEKGEEIVVDESITNVEDNKLDEHTEVVGGKATVVQVEPLAEKIEHAATIGDEIGQRQILQHLQRHEVQSGRTRSLILERNVRRHSLRLPYHQPRRRSKITSQKQL